MNNRWVLAALVVLMFVFSGMALWRERRETVRAKEEVTRLKDELEARPSQRERRGVDPIASILPIAPPVAAEPVVEEKQDEDERPAPRARRMGHRRVPADEMSDEAKGEETFAKQFELAADAWRTRSDLAKRQWVDKLALTAEQQEGFNEALAGMNEAMGDICKEFADIIEESGELEAAARTETLWRVLQATSDTVVGAYDSLGAVLTPEQNDQSRNLNLMEFIDPNVAKPLMRFEGQFRKARSGGR